MSSRNRCCWAKEISITNSECVSVALVTRHAKGVRRIILSSVACPCLSYFLTLSHEGSGFRGEKFLSIKCVFSFCLKFLSDTFPIVIRIQRNIIINICRSSREVPLFLSDFNETLIFSTDFEKYSNLKINKNSYFNVSPCIFFNSLNDKHQPMHFTFNNILV